MPLSVLATGGSVYTFNIFVVCAERERVSPRSTARYTGHFKTIFLLRFSFACFDVGFGDDSLYVCKDS